MSGTTNLQQWNPTAANQETDAQYTADSQRAGGATDTAIFQSILANKAFFQWSTYLTALFQAFAAKGFTTSDSNLNTLTAQCANFLTTADTLPAVQVINYSTPLTLNAALANGFYIKSMTGNLTITAVNGLTSGQLIVMYYQQDGVGGRTVTFPALFVAAAQPDPTPNSVSAQMFGYDVTTGYLRPIGALVSNTGAVFAENFAVTGSANLAELIVNSTAVLGKTLIGNGTSFVPRTLTMNVVTGARAFGITYTNSSGAAMTVSVIMGRNSGSSGDTRLDGTVAGTVIASNTVSTTLTGGTDGITFLVPAGATYSANATGVGGSPSFFLQQWTEWVYV